MFPYWAMFALFALAAAVERPWSEGRRARPLLFAAAGILLTLYIGLRYWVGGDWQEYQGEFALAAYWSLGDAMRQVDPAYQVLNWVGQMLGVGVWFVNLICAAIFSWGLIRLARTQPRPWLVVLLSVPYLITVVAMGYTRQAAAIGLAMAAMADVVRGASVVRAIAYIAGATLFHKSALVLLPLLSVASEASWVWTVATVPPALYGLYSTFVAPSMEHLVSTYIDTQYASSGAAIRVALVLVGAIVFLLFKRQLGFDERESTLWRNLSLSAFACLVLLFVLPSSTVVDRLALYLIPMQVVVLSRVPSTLVADGVGKTALIAFAAAVLYVWLNQGSFSSAWIPYRNYITSPYEAAM